MFASNYQLMDPPALPPTHTFQSITVGWNTLKHSLYGFAINAHQIATVHHNYNAFQFLSGKGQRFVQSTYIDTIE